MNTGSSDYALLAIWALAILLVGIFGALGVFKAIMIVVAIAILIGGNDEGG